ncbi:unnamed protein product [Protopolystoma xenopodis]|uniref:Tr-type G domain-containing protein n=1 Tax=Protopolystoma xenopodis TaxID=117903 RepID=A0A448X5S4_9PLAT|nr:unnamed protein product [Protopolystoma xenopodis]
MMGHLLYLLGNVSSKQLSKFQWEAQKMGKASFAYAWILDQTSEERSRGVTMDIAQTAFETRTKRIALLDAPGHRDFVPRVIGGASQADAALLVVNASNGEFETGFDVGLGQTREHACLVRLLGVNGIIVAVNKMDTVSWSQTRYDEIRQRLANFLKSLNLTEVVYCPVSGLTGDNLVPKSKAERGSKMMELAPWYNGPSLLEIIGNNNSSTNYFACLLLALFSFADKLPVPERQVDAPLRFVVSDLFKPVGLGQPVVAGRVISGALSAGVNLPTSRVICQPSGNHAIIKSIRSMCTSNASGPNNGNNIEGV